MAHILRGCLLDFTADAPIGYIAPAVSADFGDTCIPAIPADSDSIVSIDFKKLHRYMAVDPASGKEKRVEVHKARQAISVIAADHFRRIFALFAWAGRLPTDQFMNKIIETCELWAPRICGIEANAMQSLFVDSVALEARNRMKRLPIQPVKQPTDIKKIFRIQTILEPVINFDQLFINDDQKDLKYELRSFPTGRWMDLVDCLATAVSLVPPQLTQRTQNDELRELAAYLRRSGMPPSQIEKRLNEVKGEKDEWTPQRSALLHRPFSRSASVSAWVVGN